MLKISKQFNLTLQSFKEWMQNIGYTKKTVNDYVNLIKEVLHYLETQGINTLQDVQEIHLIDFTEQFKQRVNHTHGGGLSTSHINYMVKVIRRFLEYLKQAKQIILTVELKGEKLQVEKPDILTVDEVKQLLTSMDAVQNPLEVRDRCLIAVLYGAGLRLSELHQLDITDISLSKQTLLVKKAKGNKQRLIPLTEFTVQTIKYYLTQVRDVFTSISKQQEEALFIDIHGKRIPYYTYYDILKYRIDQCGIESIQEKRIHPHVFRHSIATHLYLAGMQMEDLAQFLGHKSLDSTMIYAHLAQTLKNNNR